MNTQKLKSVAKLVARVIKTTTVGHLRLRRPGFDVVALGWRQNAVVVVRPKVNERLQRAVGIPANLGPDGSTTAENALHLVRQAIEQELDGHKWPWPTRRVTYEAFGPVIRAVVRIRNTLVDAAWQRASQRAAAHAAPARSLVRLLTPERGSVRTTTMLPGFRTNESIRLEDAFQRVLRRRAGGVLFSGAGPTIHEEMAEIVARDDHARSHRRATGGGR